MDDRTARARPVSLLGWGWALPAQVVTNRDLEARVDTTDAWIVQRTGIRERRIAAAGEATSDLALRAAHGALAQAGLAPADLDCLIVATVTPDMPLPNTACFVQAALGIEGRPAFDVSAACTGWLYGLDLARALILAGQYRRVLVIGAECLSRMVNWEDRGTCILFADGAGAAVLGPEAPGRPRLSHLVLGAKLSEPGVLEVPGGGSRTPVTPENVHAGLHKIHMEGREVFKFAVNQVQGLVRALLDVTGLAASDVDLVIPHQVNQRIIESAAHRVGIPYERWYLHLERVGNTSAASVPMALAEAHEVGRLHPGTRTLLVAFGAGFTWGGAFLDWGDCG